MLQLLGLDKSWSLYLHTKFVKAHSINYRVLLYAVNLCKACRVKMTCMPCELEFKRRRRKKGNKVVPSRVSDCSSHFSFSLSFSFLSLSLSHAPPKVSISKLVSISSLEKIKKFLHLVKTNHARFFLARRHLGLRHSVIVGSLSQRLLAQDLKLRFSVTTKINRFLSHSQFSLSCLISHVTFLSLSLSQGIGDAGKGDRGRQW